MTKHPFLTLLFLINHLAANPTKWPNTVQKLVGNSRRIVGVFDNFVGLTLGSNTVLLFYKTIIVCVRRF